jgi:SP family sugar:H+ symporter-like MFS transporter
MGEMFPLFVRAYSASLSTMANWTWNFLLTFFTPFIVTAIEFRYGYVFAGCNFMAVVTVFFCYYESAGLNLEQVDEMYTDPKARPWSSPSWVPPGHTSRYDAAQAQREAMLADEEMRRAGGRNAEKEREPDTEHRESIPQIETNRGRFASE